jgi:hypothetical protein
MNAIPVAANLDDMPLTAWHCPWCHRVNFRRNAGEDKCDHCAAIVLTEREGDKLRVRQTVPAR